MKVYFFNLLKKKDSLYSMIRSLLLLLFAVVICLLVWFGFSYCINLKLKNIKTQDSKESGVLNKLRSMHRKLLSLEKVMRIWGKLNDLETYTPGLMVDKAKEVIQSVASSYMLSDIKINIGDITMVDGSGSLVVGRGSGRVSEKAKKAKQQKIGENNDTYIVSSVVKLNFVAVTDIDVYAFLLELFKKLPGFAVLREFNIVKLSDLDDEKIKEIYEGVNHYFVKVEMSFEWMDLAKKDMIL